MSEHSTEKAEYVSATLPGTSPAVWVDSCLLCGSLVLRRDLHDAWHFPPRLPPAKEDE